MANNPYRQGKRDAKAGSPMNYAGKSAYNRAEYERGYQSVTPEDETVPCGLCGTPTRMTGTKRCDRCYELETRIKGDPELAAQILQGLLNVDHK